jgi:hypothetical protein
MTTRVFLRHLSGNWSKSAVNDDAIMLLNDDLGSIMY